MQIKSKIGCLRSVTIRHTHKMHLFVFGWVDSRRRRRWMEATIEKKMKSIYSLYSIDIKISTGSTRHHLSLLSILFQQLLQLFLLYSCMPFTTFRIVVCFVGVSITPLYVRQIVFILYYDYDYVISANVR